MAAGWMGAGLPRPGRRLKAPGEGNRGQRGLRYGDLNRRVAGAVVHSGAYWATGKQQAARDGLKIQSQRAAQPLRTAARNALRAKLHGRGVAAGNPEQHWPSVQHAGTHDVSNQVTAANGGR
jgi:hypothetical protein